MAPSPSAFETRLIDGHSGRPARSGFLTIPMEIRLQIYEFVFNDSRVYFKADFFRRPIFRSYSTVRHQILLVCRQCQREGLVLFYGMTQWDFGKLREQRRSSRNLLSNAPFEKNGSHCKRLLAIGTDRMDSIPYEKFPALRFLSVKMANVCSMERLGEVPNVRIYKEAFGWLEKQQDYQMFVKPVAQMPRKFRLVALARGRWEVANENSTGVEWEFFYAVFRWI